VLPVTSTLTLGHTFEIHNNSTGSLTINSSGSNLVGTIEANTTATCTCILVTGTTAASWDFDVTGFTSVVPTTRGGTGLTAIGTSLQVLRTNTGATALEFATISSGTSWQSVQTTGFTAVAGRGYACDTTSSAFTVTLPSSATAGDYIQIVDYAGTFGTNNLTLNPNGLKINASSGNQFLDTNREAVILTYINATQGWLITSASDGVNVNPVTYSIEYLLVGGGGGGGGAYHAGGVVTPGGGGGGGGIINTTMTIAQGTTYNVVVGAAGTGGPANSNGTQGGNSYIGSVTQAVGGGYGAGGGGNPSGGSTAAGSGGSGGGGSAVYNNNLNAGGPGGSGTSGQGNSGGNGSSAPSSYGGGGGGGKSASGGNASRPNGASGGGGTAYSITGSSVTYSGGGYGGGDGYAGSAGSYGSGGGPTYYGGGGGGASRGVSGNSPVGINGGGGIVILKILTSNYSGTTTGSPTVTTDGSYKILQYTSSGSYTG
jgi:hypothetical protein